MKSKALYQLLTNLLIWFFVPIVTDGLAMIKSGSVDRPLPTAELIKLVEPIQLIIFLSAGAIPFFSLALISHKSTNQHTQKRAKEINNFGLDEMASSLYSFGSLLMVCTWLGAPPWYAAASLTSYGVGYYLKPE